MSNEALKPRKLNKVIAAALGRLSARSRQEQYQEQYEEPKQINFADTVRELAAEGFDTLGYGRGPWIDGKAGRIIDEWAIKNPDGRVVALTAYKTYAPSGGTVRSYLQRTDFEESGAYAGHVEEWQLNLAEDTPLADTIATLPPQPSAIE